MKDCSPGEADPAYAELSQFDRADRICDGYERQWLDGQQPQLDDYLRRVPTEERSKLRRELEAIKSDYESRRQELRDKPCVQGTKRLDSPTTTRSELDHPSRIARFRIEKLLGQGGFGRVYLAHDEQLDRRVAVKVPHAKLISKPEDADIYLIEARTVANRDSSIGTSSPVTF